MRTATTTSAARRIALACALLVLAAGRAHADGLPSQDCDIAVDPRLAVYQVVVDGEPWEGKGYMTWDDALKLRDVLVSAGACAGPAPPKPCKVELLAAGDYAVLRDGVNFNRYTKLRTLDAAREYVATLEKVALCRAP